MAAFSKIGLVCVGGHSNGIWYGLVIDLILTIYIMLILDAASVCPENITLAFTKALFEHSNQHEYRV